MTNGGWPVIPEDGPNPCRINFRKGWYCRRGEHPTTVEGWSNPCALLPKWWNIRDRWRFRDYH